MEKYSGYNDPLSGINPFLNPKKQTHSFIDYLKGLLSLHIILLLFMTNLNVVRFLIRIKSNEVVKPRIIAANASSFLDVYVLRYLTGIKNYYYLSDDGFIDIGSNRVCQKPLEPCVVFPEGCRTNNRAVLQFVRNINVDHVCGLRYSGECINLYDGLIGFILRFLASRNSVSVQFKRSTNMKDICEVSGLPQVKWSVQDRNEFMKRFEKTSS